MAAEHGAGQGQSGTLDQSPPPAGPAPGKRKPWLLWLLVAVLVLFGIWWLQSGSAPADAPAEGAEAPAAPAAAMQLLPSEVHKVERGTLRDTVQLTGSLAPIQDLSIPAEVAGRVDQVAFKVGESVAQGQELVTIDVESLKNRLEQQRATAAATGAQLNLARAQLQRAEDLVKRGVSAMSTLETEAANVAQLEANYAALMRQVATAEDDLGKARITAPFAGIVAERAVDPGAYVNVGTTLMRLVDTTSLDLEAGVPVIHAARLKPGQSVELSVDGIADHRFAGVIERIAPVAAEGTRMLPIYARIENADDMLKGGMFASGILVLEEAAESIGIPADALRKDETGDYVIKIQDGKAIRQPVELGRKWSRDRIVEITSGLEAGDLIAALNLERLSGGMAVTLLER